PAFQDSTLIVIRGSWIVDRGNAFHEPRITGHGPRACIDIGTSVMLNICMTKLLASQIRQDSGSIASQPLPETTDRASPRDSKHPCASSALEPILGAALFRVLRAMVFEQQPLPELNALPMAQLRLLWAVRFHPGSTMKDLSERLGVSQ